MSDYQIQFELFRLKIEALRDPSCTWPYQVGDRTPPALVSIVIDSTGTKATLLYDDRLDGNNVPPPSAYTLTGTITSVTAVKVTGLCQPPGPNLYRLLVELTLSPPVHSGQTITLSYTPPISENFWPCFTGRARDDAGNDVVAITAHAVTNGSAVP